MMIAASVLFLTVAARAQVAVYVTSSSAHLSNVAAGEVALPTPPNGPGGYQERYATFWASGIGGGVTLNFLSLGPVKMGFDFRGSTRPGTPGADTGMAGLKVGFNLPVIHIKPYIQASGGYVGSRAVDPADLGTFSNKYLAWEILGGIDYPLVKVLDLRVIEVGGGTGMSLPGSAGGPNIPLFTINTGVVLHF